MKLTWRPTAVMSDCATRRHTPTMGSYIGEERYSDYTISLETTPQTFDGRRWFVCLVHRRPELVVGNLEFIDDSEQIANDATHDRLHTRIAAGLVLSAELV